MNVLELDVHKRSEWTVLIQKWPKENCKGWIWTTNNTSLSKILEILHIHNTYKTNLRNIKIYVNLYIVETKFISKNKPERTKQTLNISQNVS